MQPGALRALEFDRIVEAVKTLALTPMGTERLGRLQPSLDPRTVANLLAHTSEAARFLAASGALPLRASDDLPQIFAALAVEGRALEALRLLALAAFLDSLDESRTLIRRTPGSFPLLEAISTWANAVELEELSVKDYDRYENTEHNWRVRKGLGSLFVALAEGLPIAFEARRELGSGHTQANRPL